MRWLEARAAGDESLLGIAWCKARTSTAHEKARREEDGGL